jgi:prepilin-type processing-associated H-X9-DG protein
MSGNPSFPAHKKVSSINRPGPSMAFVFVDESHWTIDDGYFAVNGINQGDLITSWQNFPAFRHGGSASFSFADGHSEIKKWKNESTGKLTGSAGFATIKPPNDDLRWISSRYIEVATP